MIDLYKDEIILYYKICRSIKSCHTINQIYFMDKYIYLAIKNKYIQDNIFINNINKLYNECKYNILMNN